MSAFHSRSRPMSSAVRAPYFVISTAAASSITASQSPSFLVYSQGNSPMPNHRRLPPEACRTRTLTFSCTSQTPSTVASPHR